MRPSSRCYRSSLSTCSANPESFHAWSLSSTDEPVNYGTSDRKRSKITTLLQRRASELANLPYSLAQRVTEFESNIAEYVEATVYSYQKNDLGGITTQSWLNGSFFGTANAKATSALLVAYNDQLIHNLHNTAR